MKGSPDANQFSPSKWRHRLAVQDAGLEHRRRRFESDCRCHLTEEFPPLNFFEMKTCNTFRLFLRGLFQYGDSHLGQTLGSPTVLFLGTYSWGQRPHLYPSCLRTTIAMV